MRVLAPFVVLVACSGDDTDKTDTTTDTTETTPPIEDSGTRPPPEPLTGQFGSVVLGQVLDSAAFGPKDFKNGHYAFGIALSDGGGLANLAHCLIVGDVCTDVYPEVGDTYSPTPDLKFLYSADLRDSGSMNAAGVQLDYVSQAGISFGALAALEGPGNFSITGGELAAFDDPDAFPVAEGAFGAVTPDPLQALRVGPGDTITFTWENEGTVGGTFLSVGEIVVGLDDSAGTYELSVDDAGFQGPVAGGVAYLSRITTTEVDAAGNSFQIQTRIDQPFSIEYVDPKAVDELEDGVTIADDCASAKALTPVGAGAYFGTTADYANSVELKDKNPITGYATAGLDGFVRVDLTKGQQLDVAYTQIVQDATVYLFDGTCGGTPAAGADGTLGGDEESFSFTATQTGPVYIGLDTWVYYGPEGGLFTLDLTITDP
ncbi:MAG: PPC domain-containing protein [Myxococcales bacterium]|nr:PPC domain-containing protein [Myxococcales bacterium]